MVPTDAVLSLLESNPGITVRDLIGLLRRSGTVPPSKSELNSYLYRSPHLRRVDTGGLPKWYVNGARPQGPVTPAAPARPLASGMTLDAARQKLELYPWQVRALSAWQHNGYRGVVEAVTGAGKTRVALAAAAMHLSAGGRVAVLVHTHELVRQWVKELARVGVALDRVVSIGRLGGGDSQHLGRVDILVATAQSAMNELMWRDGSPGLLIADEVHHYGADAWSRGLEEQFTRRLGLTATYDRDDNGVTAFLDPYFGGVCYSVGYREALGDGVIAPFRIGFVGVPLSSQERNEYEDQSLKLGRYKNRLVDGYGVPAEPFGEFMKATARLRRTSGEGARWAGFYLGAFQKRRKLLSSARAKLERLPAIAPAIHTAERTILFSQTHAAAAAAVTALESAGVRGDVLHSNMDIDGRHTVFATFENGELNLLAAPRLLDEGIDVPAADLAIVLASSRSKRQMIQRMGRVVRPKPDGRQARVAIFFAEATSEDPNGGAHEDFVDVVREASSDVQYFNSRTPPRELIEYLSQSRP